MMMITSRRALHWAGDYYDYDDENDKDKDDDGDNDKDNDIDNDKDKDDNNDNDKDEHYFEAGLDDYHYDDDNDKDNYDDIDKDNDYLEASPPPGGRPTSSSSDSRCRQICLQI